MCYFRIKINLDTTIINLSGIEKNSNIIVNKFAEHMIIVSKNLVLDNQDKRILLIILDVFLKELFLKESIKIEDKSIINNFQKDVLRLLDKFINLINRVFNKN